MRRSEPKSTAVFRLEQIVRFSEKCAENRLHSKLESTSNPKPAYIKKATTAALKRGTGGRSSFSGIVATVFGSSGFLGRYVVNQLGKIGTQLILPYRGDPDCMRGLKVAGDLGQVLFTPYNLKDEDSICKSIKYSNTVVNLIGRDWQTKNYSFSEVHVEGARRLAQISKTMGVQKFIHISALNVHSHPKAYMKLGGSKWLASKSEGEQAVLEEFPEAVIFRPSDMIGSEDRFVRYFSSYWRHYCFKMPLYKKGEAAFKQPVYVGDVAAGIVEAARNRNLKCEIIQAIGPRRYQLSELVDWFHRIMRKDQKYGEYKRYDLRWAPAMRLWISLLPKLTLGNPIGNLTWEQVERECHSDEIDCSLKRLEDLGIEPTCIEDVVPWLLRCHRAWSYYHEELGEFDPPEPPKYIRDDTLDEAEEEEKHFTALP